MMARWLKFNAAGILGVGVQLGLLYMFTHYAGLNYLPATVIAVEAATLHNFLWHEKYTWRLRTKLDPRSALRRLVHLNLSNGAVSLIGNLMLMKLLVDWAALPIVAANLVAIAACSIVNFIVAEFFVFAVKPEANDGELFV